MSKRSKWKRDDDDDGKEKKGKNNPTFNLQKSQNLQTETRF